MCKTTLLMKKSAWEPEGSCQAGGCVRVHVRVWGGGIEDGW